MKNSYFFLAILLVMALCLELNCKKADQVFNGSARVRGLVEFQNYLTGTQDTAKTAVLTLTRTDDSGTPYVQTLTNGTFDIQSLNKGSYSISVQFDYKQPGFAKTDHYTGTMPFSLSKNEFKDQVVVLISLSTTGGATLQVTVQDSTGAVVSNAQVALYTDPKVLAANRGTTNGSLATVSTNISGKAIFGNLQTGTYYISANVAAGNQLLSNATTDQVKKQVLSASLLDTVTVTVKPNGASLQFTVTDATGAAVNNANVYLYTDKTVLAKYRETALGSVKLGVTNSSGVVVFNGLSNTNYYASAYLVIDAGDTLSNRNNDTLAYKPSANNNVIKLAEYVSPSFTVTVVDVGMANLSGVNVSLYTDHSLLDKYRGTTIGSVVTGVTDANGRVTFSNVSPVSYFISAYKVIGTDTLSNKANDAMPFKVLPNMANTDRVTVSQ